MKKQSPFFGWNISALLGAVLLLAACGLSEHERQRLSQAERMRLQREDSLALKIAVLPTLDCLPLYVMKAHQLYDTAQLDLRLKPYLAQMDCDTAFRNRHVEGMVSDLVRTERLKQQGIGVDYLTATNAYWQLYTNRLARLRRLNQLGDKMVAMTRFSATDYLTNRTLDTVKTRAQVFRVQFNNVLIRLDMLLNNEIDALWLTEPQATKARILGNPMLRDSRDFKVALGVLALRTAGVSDARRKAQLAAFVKGYNRACDSLNQRGLQAYADVIARRCKADKATLQALPKLHYSHIAPPRQQDIAAAAHAFKD